MFDCKACGCPDAWFPIYSGQIRDGATGQYKHGEIVECDICGVRKLKQEYTLGISAYESGAYRNLLHQSHLVADVQNLHMQENRKHIIVIGARNRKIIDIGCGSGCILNLFQNEYGNDGVYGIEPDSRYRKQLQVAGFKVFSSIDEFNDGPVDLSLLLNVIEHVDDPVNLLKQAASVSRGKVLICTPECDFKMLDSKQGIRKEFYRTQHTWYFNEYSLKKCIKHAGLDYISTVRLNDSHMYIWAEVK